jgi:hypothetical protein
MPGLGRLHLFDWDEINFAEIAREMLITGNYAQVQVDFAPFYEKPPFFFWLQVLSMKLWGVNEFAARFPNAVVGIITIYSIYKIGGRIKNSRLGILWAFMYLSAILPHFYFKTGIIDPVFNYFIFVGIYSLVRLASAGDTERVTSWALLGGLSIGLAILTKGPVGILLPVLTGCIYWICNKCQVMLRLKNLFIWLISAVLPPLSWLGYETYLHGPDFIQAFLRYQVELFNQPVAGHGQGWYYHFLVVLVGCFPASVLALESLFKKNRLYQDPFRSVMQILFWVVMGLFSLVTTKIIHYSSMVYFPVTFLAAEYLYSLDTGIKQVQKRVLISLGCMASLLTGLFVAVPLLGILKDFWCYQVTDDFTKAMIAMPVPWGLQDCLVGIIYGTCNIIAYWLFRKKEIVLFGLVSSLATMVLLSVGARLIVPKIEAHIQKPAIEFYKELVGQDVYITTVGFKSYAPYFYARQPYARPCQRKERNWLLRGNIDKPAYFVVKSTDKGLLEGYAEVKLIKTEGGFSFYSRNKVTRAADRNDYPENN